VTEIFVGGAAGSTRGAMAVASVFRGASIVRVLVYQLELRADAGGNEWDDTPSGLR